MSPEEQIPLAFLRPGGVFLLVLALIVAAGVVLHALLARRFGHERFDRWTRHTEGFVFCVFLAAMLILSGLQVVLRNFFRAGVLWVDPLVRSLVLWVAFLGAMTATSQARHLHIDVLHRWLPRRVAQTVSRGLSILSAVCCALLANGAYIYLRDEYGYGVSPFLGIPSWATQSVLLWGFALLAYRFLVQAFWPAPREGEGEPAGLIHDHQAAEDRE